TMIYSKGAEWLPAGSELKPDTMYKMRLEPLDQGAELPEQIPVWGEQLKAEEAVVTLAPGWNWMPYTPLTTMTVGVALAAANPQQGDYVKSQRAIAIYGPNGWEGNLKALESGHGYMYHSTDTKTKQFTYPRQKDNRNLAAQRQLSFINSQLSIFHPVDNGAYPDNMTMVILLVDANQPVDTCEVAAFIDGECRGATRAIGGLYYLVIAGEGSGQSLDLRTCLDDTIVSIDRNISYTTDRNIGTPWEPYIIDLANADAIRSVSADPDADDEWYTLQGIKVGHRPQFNGIYIHNGEKVIVKPNTKR
ncbi:MAG: hypothetical protein IJ253_01805, partial [Bacteroidaceae bacterium]|nr:hypothetical protein [Bacteroidaceae bacterium]